jgi:hypothetical protein
MRPAALRPAAVLSVATLLVWTTRIRNIWSDEELTLAGQLGRTALAMSFTVLAVGGLVLWLLARRSGAAPRAARPLVRAFAGWTTAVWVVRGVQIALADHDAAFVAVHTALAAGSIALAVWADRAVHAGGAGDAPRPRQLSSSP